MHFKLDVTYTLMFILKFCTQCFAFSDQVWVLFLAFLCELYENEKLSIG